MSLMRFNVHSELLQRYVDISIVLPTDNLSFLPNPAQPMMPAHLRRRQRHFEPGDVFRTVYLLHGGGDDDSLTYRYTNAEYYAQQCDLMLVTPGIPNSFGADTEYGIAYQAFLGEELPRMIRALFPSSPRREDTVIMGYAMGGNAALAAAIRYPENYSLCVDISGGIGYTLRTDTLQSELDGEHFRQVFPLYNSSFGDAAHLPGSHHDLHTLLKERLKQGAELPKFRLACGSREFIRGRLEDDASILRFLGLSVLYDCEEGYDHDFVFWDYYLKKVMRQLFPPQP